MPSNEILSLPLQVDYEKVDQVAFINLILLHGESITWWEIESRLKTTFW